jgi:hypothetical protein
VIALVSAGLTLVDHEFFSTMAAATGEGESPPGWTRLPALVGLPGAILLWRRPLAGVMVLVAAAVTAFVIAAVTQPTLVYAGGLFLVAAVLGSLDRRSPAPSNQQ